MPTKILAPNPLKDGFRFQIRVPVLRVPTRTFTDAAWIGALEFSFFHNALAARPSSGYCERKRAL